MNSSEREEGEGETRERGETRETRERGEKRKI
jgi:hypothetical protein